MGDEEKPHTYLEEARSSIDLAASELARARSALDADDLEEAESTSARLREYSDCIAGNVRRERERRALALNRAAPALLKALKKVAGEPGREHERVKQELDEVIRAAEGKGRAV